MALVLKTLICFTASIMTPTLLGRGSIYENAAFSAGSCGFVFMNTVPLTFLSFSYHRLKKCCHSGKQGLSGWPVTPVSESFCGHCYI